MAQFRVKYDGEAMIVHSQYINVIIVAFVLFIGIWITGTPAGETFYDAGGSRIGEVKQSRRRKNYYGSGGKLLGWSKLSGGKYRYYDRDGKFLGYSSKEAGRAYFYKIPR